MYYSLSHSKCVKIWIKRSKKEGNLCFPISQLPGGLFSPSDEWKKLPQTFLLYFPFGMDTYDYRYQGLFPLLQ